MTINWSEKLDKFGRRFLQHFGVDPDWLPTASNAVCDIVKSDPASVVAFMESDPKGSIIAVSRLAVACQMAVYDRVGGPEGDREPKGLRRHWYHWYKVNFALPLSLALGENPNDPKWGLNWAGRLSQTYGWYVDRKGATYTDLWVKDASRMMQIFGTELFPRANIIICVEKDSLFDDFVAASRAIGAKALISGKGKSSKAAIEKLLRDARLYPEQESYDFSTNRYRVFQPITWDRPLVVLHISDHDYDGQAVIGPTFGDQMTRYTEHVLEARVGLIPHQVTDVGEDLADKIYQVKMHNKAYVRWAKDEGLFDIQCLGCDTNYIAHGEYDTCPGCGIEAGFSSNKTAHGLEVEALSTRDYYSFIVDALLGQLDFDDDIVPQLREWTHADPWSAARFPLNEVRDRNESYRNLLDEIERLTVIRDEFDREVEESFYIVADRQKNMHDMLGDDPEVSDLADHVTSSNTYSEPWRPFSVNERTEALGELLVEEGEELIEALAEVEIEF